MVCLVSLSLRNDEVNQVDSGLFPLENTLLFKAWEMDNRRKGNALIVRTPRLWPRVCWLNCFVDKFVVSLNFTFLNYKTNNKKWISSICYILCLWVITLYPVSLSQGHNFYQELTGSHFTTVIIFSLKLKNLLPVTFGFFCNYFTNAWRSSRASPPFRRWRRGREHDRGSMQLLSGNSHFSQGDKQYLRRF